MYRKNGWLLANIGMLCLIEFLQSGMIAFASTPIRGEIEASPEEYSLIAALYACTAVVVISKQNWLVERLGWRNYVWGSCAVFIFGAVVAGASHSVAFFALGRVIMALGGASFMTTGRVLIQLMPAPLGRFVGITVFAASLATGLAAAPFIASWAVADDTWQAIFAVLILCALIIATLAWKALPSQPYPHESRSETHLGAVLLLASGAFFALYELQRSYYDFYDDRSIVMLFAVFGAFAVYSYFHIEHRRLRPLLKVAHLKGGRYLFGVAIFSVCYVILGATNYILPVFMQTGMGLAWQTVGVLQSIGFSAALITWGLMTLVIPKFPSPKKFYFLGLSALLSFCTLFTLITPQPDVWRYVLPGLVLNGCFIMLMLATTAMQTFRDVGHDDVIFSNAQQIKNMFNQIATALGTAIATVFMQWRSTVHYGNLNVGFEKDNAAFVRESAAMTQHFSLFMDAASAAKVSLVVHAQQLATQASFLAGVDYFRALSWVGVLLFLIIAGQKIFK